jgi:hypothetical protein
VAANTWPVPLDTVYTGCHTRGMTTNEIIQKAASEIRAIEAHMESLMVQEMVTGHSTRTERDALQARQNDLYLIASDEIVWAD